VLLDFNPLPGGDVVIYLVNKLGGLLSEFWIV